jgi:hypothetical protein
MRSPWNDEPQPVVPFAVTGSLLGCALGAVAGGSGGDLRPFGDVSGWAVFGLYALLPICLVAVCHNISRGLAPAKVLLWAPLVIVGQLTITAMWFVGYFVVLPAPAVIATLWLYYHPPIASWPPVRLAGLGGIAVLAGWLYLLWRSPARDLINAFYDAGPRALRMFVAGVLAAIPFLCVGALLAYYLGFLEEMSWQAGRSQGFVGALLGAVYGASVGFFAPFAAFITAMLSKPDLSVAKTPASGQMVDLSVRIRPLSQLDDHSPAPPVSASPLPLRWPPSARNREPGLAPPALGLQTNDGPA